MSKLKFNYLQAMYANLMTYSGNTTVDDYDETSSFYMDSTKDDQTQCTFVLCISEFIKIYFYLLPLNPYMLISRY